MVTPQQNADVELARWQALREIELTPAERMSRLIADFFLPPIDLDTKYEDQLRAVAEEMNDAQT